MEDEQWLQLKMLFSKGKREWVCIITTIKAKSLDEKEFGWYNWLGISLFSQSNMKHPIKTLKWQWCNKNPIETIQKIFLKRIIQKSCKIRNTDIWSQENWYFCDSRNFFYPFCDRSIFTSTFLCDKLYKNKAFSYWKSTTENKTKKVRRRCMCNKMRSSKHNNELFFLKFTLLNGYIIICNSVQNRYKIYNSHFPNLVSTKLMYLWTEALNYNLLSLSSREVDKNVTRKV